MIYVDGRFRAFSIRINIKYRAIICVLVYILIESCVNFFLKYLIFLEKFNIGHLIKISWDYFWPPKFSEKKLTIYLLYICVYAFENVFPVVEIVVLLTKI